jgi:hypothetical protein
VTDIASLRATELELQQAQLRSDVETLERLLHDDETHVGHDGAITGKSFDVENHRTGRVRVDRLEPEDLQVLISDGVGVTIFTGTIAGTLEERPFLTRVRNTRAWGHHPQHGWRVVAAHMTVLGPSTV